MTALRWFLSYLLPILIVASIAAGYFYREQLLYDWYRTLSWPVMQINAVLQQQKLQLNVVKPEISTELTTKKSVPDTLAMTSDAQVISEIKSKNKLDETIVTEEKPVIHPIESSENANLNTETATPLVNPVTPLPPKIPILSSSSAKVTPKSSHTKAMPADNLAVAPQAQQRVMPYPQQRMMPPIMKPATPAFMAPNYYPIRRPAPEPPTQFKLDKKQRRQLYQARKFFWMRDFKNANKQYLTLTKQLSDNPDIHGELGNIFYQQGKLESAIKHYTIAAKLLIKHRHYWKLPQIMKIVSRYNPAKANEVMQLMRSRNSVASDKPGNSKKGK